MELPVVKLPQSVPLQRLRPPQANIPQTRAEREEIRAAVARFVDLRRPVPPVPVDELRRLTGELMTEHGWADSYLNYVAVLLNNRMWREHLAAVPYERRLLLLPKCLRVEDRCPAPFDEFGLLCKQCGLCTIQDLQAEAERLGYAVLVAEGSALVMQLIQSGKVEAIVGVSCLSVLEMAFPYTEAAAIPCIAIPLLQDDCKDTTVDLEWVWEVIHLSADDRTHRLDLDHLKDEVAGWFEEDALRGLLGGGDGGTTEDLAVEWLGRSGKRWRPYLAAAACKALQDDPQAPLPAALARVALAVECFHKASLIHDDIEDGDDLRYGQKALHAEHGVAVALNVGDYLVGEGYRLLAECGAPAAVRSRLLEIAARGHRSLCIGQGRELWWEREPRPLKSREILGIFQEKTAPAFEVSLKLGALVGGAADRTLEVLEEYSRNLGVAYQIRDDLGDLEGGDEPDDVAALRPTLPLALAAERARGEDREFMKAVWRRERRSEEDRARIRRILALHQVEERGRELLEMYKEEATRSLMRLENASLKGLLRRVVGKIFGVEIKGWCSEFETRDAAGGEAVAQVAG